jgi:hypothetical protein
MNSDLDTVDKCTQYYSLTTLIELQAKNNQHPFGHTTILAIHFRIRIKHIKVRKKLVILFKDNIADRIDMAISKYLHML